MQAIQFYASVFLTSHSSILHTARYHFNHPSLLFQNMVYYKISHVDGRITHPEQRIASDVPRFSSELSELILDDLTAVTDGILYAWRLCSYASPKYIFWILVILA